MTTAVWILSDFERIAVGTAFSSSLSEEFLRIPNPNRALSARETVDFDRVETDFFRSVVAYNLMQWVRKARDWLLYCQIENKTSTLFSIFCRLQLDFAHLPYCAPRTSFQEYDEMCGVVAAQSGSIFMTRNFLSLALLQK